MNIITLTRENLEKEHICCAISNNNDCQVASKKAWLAERFDDGLVFKKGDVRGKCFIEYIPAENAPSPITTYALFYNGEYLTNEVLNDKRFLKLIQKEN